MPNRRFKPRSTSDRERNAGEDVVDWAVATGRTLAATAPQWRARLTDNPNETRATLEAAFPVPAFATDEPPTSGGHGGRAPAGRFSISVPGGGRRVRPDRQIDAAYAVNPEVDRIAAKHSADGVYAKAAKDNPEYPRLFGKRDLPPVTASGLEPHRLLELPWQVRHAAAMEADPGRVYAIFRDYADDPDAAAFDFGLMSSQPDQTNLPGVVANRDYVGRCAKWAMGINPDTGQMHDAPIPQVNGEPMTDEALLSRLFGDSAPDAGS